MGRILLIEDDNNTAFMVEEALTSSGHVVDTANTGPSGLDFILQQHYDLAIIDWDLPGISGYEICREYRSTGGKMPVLFLTARIDVTNRVEALDSGADDYLCKPFSFDELHARVSALLRRQNSNPDEILYSGTLEVNLSTGEVKVGTELVSLTAGEFLLLKFLVSNPGQIYSASSLISNLFVVDSESSEHAIAQKVLSLRKKLKKVGHDRSISTIKGQGYRFTKE